MNRLTLIAGALALPLLAACATAPYGPPPPGGPPPVAAAAVPPAPQFVLMAAQTDAYERQAGQMAASQGQDPRVRSFGDMMVRDHGMTSAELQQAAASAGIAPAPPTLRPDHAQMIQQLQAAGPNFDQVYAAQQVRVHREALDLMRGYAAAGDQPALRAVAARAAPIVHEHLRMARDMNNARRGR